MVSPEGIKSYETRQSVWEGVRSEPAQVPDSPWAPVITRAVARDRERRQNSAHTLIRELEDVTLRVEGAEDLHPYPGLASFTESDAEYFFGREAEVEQMWRKLEGPARMLALMGPSGAGKSSFIAAGLVANAPPGWGIIRSTPGNTAISSLASVVARELAGDPDAVELLPRFDDADVAVRVLAHWSRKNAHSLLVVDQFEELFTQNTPGEQRRFADLVKRLVLEGDIHVLLSMRDDFAAPCNAHESLRPIFHELTVLDPPTGANLRRAMVQPAQKCGYRFEDDNLAEEMLAEVEGERGALPLLAFALGRLWENRNRETGLLTREACREIGGVGGALAQHAEATIDRIGTDRVGVVREIFRNLVTAEGTRAVREWNELLSVFGSESTPLSSRASDLSRRSLKAEPEASRGTPRSRRLPPEKSGDPSTRASDALAQDDRRGEAAEVLRELINARLLTSYEVREEDTAPTRRVEIIHESLLANWPRLVRWQTQDADAAQLRDQLRQASRTWDEQGRSDDTLWTGAAYREFASWRERYPGGLSEIEEAFAQAMTTHAKRRTRRRRIAVAAGFATLLVISVVVGGFWRQSISEARRAEAANLFSVAQLRLLDKTLDRRSRIRHRQPRAGGQSRGAAPGPRGSMASAERRFRLPASSALLGRLQPRRPLAGHGRTQRRRRAVALGRRSPNGPRGQQCRDGGLFQSEGRSRSREHGPGEANDGALVRPGGPAAAFVLVGRAGVHHVLPVLPRWRAPHHEHRNLFRRILRAGASVMAGRGR